MTSKDRVARGIAAIALAVALSGGTAAVAGSLITSADIKDGSIRKADLASSAISALKGKKGERGADGSDGVNGLPGPVGPTGPAGAVGVPGGFNPAKVTYLQGAPLTVFPGEIATAVAACPVGSKAIAGGFFGSITHVAASNQIASGAGWYVLVANDTTIDVEIWAYAVCASL